MTLVVAALPSSLAPQPDTPSCLCLELVVLDDDGRPPLYDLPPAAGRMLLTLPPAAGRAGSPPSRRSRPPLLGSAARRPMIVAAAGVARSAVTASRTREMAREFCYCEWRSLY